MLCPKIICKYAFNYKSCLKKQIRTITSIIDGKKIASEIRAEVQQGVIEWTSLGNRPPNLTALLIGKNAASVNYVKNKMKAAEEVGITSKTIRLPETVTEQDVLDYIHKLNQDDEVDGILVQLPLPPHIRRKVICNSVSPLKDVDGFSAVNIGRFCMNMKSIIPCTALAVQEIILRAGILTTGKHAVVCGRSKNVGQPIAMILNSDGTGGTIPMNATVSVCHRFTNPELMSYLTKSADIIVSATGIPNLLRGNMIKKGVCIIDVGITRIQDEHTKKGKYVGDVDFESVKEVAGHITPVPGGVGPVTVASLMKNTLIAARKEVEFDSWDVKHIQELLNRL